MSKLPETITLRDLICWVCRIKPKELDLTQYYGRVARNDFKDDDLFRWLVEKEIVITGHILISDFQSDHLIKSLIEERIIRTDRRLPNYVSFYERDRANFSILRDIDDLQKLSGVIEIDKDIDDIQELYRVIEIDNDFHELYDFLADRTKLPKYFHLKEHIDREHEFKKEIGLLSLIIMPPP